MMVVSKYRAQGGGESAAARDGRGGAELEGGGRHEGGGGAQAHGRYKNVSECRHGKVVCVQLSKIEDAGLLFQGVRARGGPHSQLLRICDCTGND